MTLTVNTTATTKELINEALNFCKYGNDIEAVIYINEILTTLKDRMILTQFVEFQKRVLKLINEN